MKMPIELVQNFQNSTSSGTTLTTTFSNLTVGNVLICAFVVRSDIVSISDGWEYVGGGEQSVPSTNQKLHFAKKVITNSTETLTVTQTTSARIYIVCGEFSNVKNVVYDPTMSKLGTGDYTVTGTKTENSVVFYGVHSFYYLTGRGREQSCSPNDLIKLEGDTTEERLACWFDNGNGETTHTFKTCNSTSTKGIAEVDGVYLIPFETKYLISEGETVYSWNGTELTTTELNYSQLTGDDFENSGFDEITTMLCDILKSHVTFKILHWQDDIETAVPLYTAKITGTPEVDPTLIFDVDFSDVLTGIESVQAVFDGSPLMAFSVDNGVTWWGYAESWTESDMYVSNCHLLTESVMTEFLGENKQFKVRITLTAESEFTSLKIVYREE